MRKINKIFLLLFVLIFLSTFSEKDNKHKISSNNIFYIKNINIKNNFLIKTKDLENKLENLYKKNIFFIKKKDIANPLEKTNFLEKIEVKKKYPNTIIIKVYETKPMAILIKKDVKYLIDSSSNLINFIDEYNSGDLPNVFGINAEKYFISFFDQLKINNFPYYNIKNFYYFQIGRWNVEFLNNKIIKFPHNNTKKAIIKSLELLKNENFKKYNSIDLRVDGKIIVE
jgi:cell division septal protein FtsQ